MGHHNYMKSGFSSPKKQRNVIAFIGNGFDIQAMRDYGSHVDTRYETFYHFLKLRSFDEENRVFREMDALRQQGKKDWSDVESIVAALLGDNWAIASRLSADLLALQGQFAEFLDLAVPSSLLVELGEDSMRLKLAVESLEGFLGDLDPDEYRNLSFPGRCENFDVYNFLFFNFNYTSIFDNFIYLDQKQFDPMPYRTVDRNFRFQGNPASVTGASVRPGDSFSSYLMTEIVHPHGSQGIPRSLLFGIDAPIEVHGNQDQALRLAKSFWAQNDKRYDNLFEDTELFVIFGCSLGVSDRWWWRKIADSLGHERMYPESGEPFTAELIIYWYDPGMKMSADDVRAHFLSSADAIARRSVIESSIHVVTYDSETSRTWLRTSRTS